MPLPRPIVAHVKLRIASHKVIEVRIPTADEVSVRPGNLKVFRYGQSQFGTNFLTPKNFPATFLSRHVEIAVIVVPACNVRASSQI